MLNRLITAAALGLAFVSAAQAQTTCSCNPSNASPAPIRTASTAALTNLLTNKMVCGGANGNYTWQEWHNGTSGGPIVDYKLGPNSPSDPSTTVGSYVVNGNNTVTYNYANGGGSYTYEVCYASASNTYSFCGKQFGGDDIGGLVIGGSGSLQSCSALSSPVRSARPTPAPAPIAPLKN